MDKIKFIPWLMFCAAIGLLMCAFAVNLPMLWLGTVIVGLFWVLHFGHIEVQTIGDLIKLF